MVLLGRGDGMFP